VSERVLAEEEENLHYMQKKAFYRRLVEHI
jgi:hypothetical protein